MPYIPPSVVQEVKRMDLFTYLKNYEPYELVHFSGNTYTTRTHDSLKISNGKWMWWSQRTGGRSALDYLIKVRGYSFLEAVELLAKQANIQPSLSVSENVPMEKQLLLPKKNQDDQKVIAYLSGRGIDKEIIQFCLESGRVYESAFHHNAVFAGMDEKDNPKYAAIRGTGTSFIGEANGSDKNYSFSIFTEKSCDTMHLFESAIDLLSYATLLKLDGKEWRREHLLSLAGVYQPANNGVQMVGVQVRLQEENVCPVVYVEPFFNEIRLGEPVEKVMNEIARCMEEAGNVPFLHSGINPMDYDSVKEHLAVMLVNTQANKRMLQEMPHENMEDLSAICYVDFPVESNDGKATMKVKNEHLKMWNVDAKEMFQQARANTQPVNTPILQSMDEMLLSIFNEEGHATNLLDENVDFGLRSHDMLYALTNVEKQYGASMITQPEVLNKLEQLFPEGFYVLPSSVHEVLIVPDNGEMEPKMLGEMVREVNKNEVERQEVLSDRVYSYDKEKHQIRQEPDSIQKVKEMER